MDCSGIDPSTFAHISPSRLLTFTFPNANPDSAPLCVSVLDSPKPTPATPLTTAAMLVPSVRAHDWIFTTAAGHRDLLLTAPLPLSRLVLISGADPGSEESLIPLLLALSPKAAFANGLPDTPFIEFTDDILHITPVERITGSIAGEMLVEDVHLVGGDRRRRLRFRRNPNLIQSQVRLISDPTYKFEPEAGSLAQPYLAPMVAGLSLIAAYVEEKQSSGSMPRALCLGVGGGALLMFLRLRLGFVVVGVDADDVVLDLARRRFGMVEDESLRVIVGDGVKLLRRFAQETKIADRFDVIMVDLDSANDATVAGAPPPEFVRRDVLVGVRSILDERGIVVVNVIEAERSSYDAMVATFREVFAQLYELNPGNCENHILIATVSAVRSDEDGSGMAFTDKLKEAVGGEHVDSIKKI